ncbi:MAG: hypothetical protein ABSE95_06305 [Thermodesulfobacteriota bacterium]|jgi:non-ribosomal peptide synthetase component E (peptide arylation enzyme)
MNLAQILSDRARAFGPKTAVRICEQERSYVDLDHQVKQAASSDRGKDCIVQPVIVNFLVYLLKTLVGEVVKLG